MQCNIADMLEPESRAFYHETLTTLQAAEVPFLLGGAYAFCVYTGIARDTKDLDLFVRRADYDQVAQVLTGHGFHTELTYPHWLGKASNGTDSIDIIFGSGSGMAPVDDEWLTHAVSGEVLGLSVQCCPAEEMIWSKAFVMERERYDGADVAHLIRAQGHRMDWHRILRRFEAQWPVLLSHLVLFEFIYPSEREQVPDWILNELLERQQATRQQPAPGERICNGTVISREQYLIDVEEWGYRDGRLPPNGSMTAKDIAQWTDSIGSD